MASIVYELYGSNPVSMLTVTELNALANGSGSVLGTEFDNSVASNWTRAQFEGVFDFGAAPTAGTTIDLYLVKALDGSNYELYTSGASEVVQGATYLGSFEIPSATDPIRLSVRGVQGEWSEIPPCKFKLAVVNNSGQALHTSGSTVKMILYRLKTA